MFLMYICTDLYMFCVILFYNKQAKMAAASSINDVDPKWINPLLINIDDHKYIQVKTVKKQILDVLFDRQIYLTTSQRDEREENTLSPSQIRRLYIGVKLSITNGKR